MNKNSLRNRPTPTAPDSSATGASPGNSMFANNSTVTLTLSSGTFQGGSTTASVAASGGVATFSTLRIDNAGSYTMNTYHSWGAGLTEVRGKHTMRYGAEYWVLQQANATPQAVLSLLGR